jgi:3-deoxy-D-manno-octulosonic acid (KDO) 8-phosphate synthase
LQDLCVIEDEGLCLEIAKELVGIGKKTASKSSSRLPDKANRTSIDSFAGRAWKKASHAG